MGNSFKKPADLNTVTSDKSLSPEIHVVYCGAWGYVSYNFFSN